MALAVVVLIILIILSAKWLGGGDSSVQDNLDRIGDCDGDEVVNYLDKCPKAAGYKEYDGCNTADPTDDDKKRCDSATKEACKCTSN